MTYQAQQKPDTKFRLVYFTPPTDEQIAAKPEFKDFRQIQIAFCRPAPYLTKLRQGVDRPADWTPPTI